MLGGSTPEPRTLTAAGTAVTYYDSLDEHGREEVLVLVHGTAGSTRSHFGFLFPILSAKQRVVAIDWAAPDLGDGRLELEHLLDQVVGVVEQVLGDRKVVLLGYSLGAVVTAAVAARRPDLIDRLILVAGWIKTDLQQILRNDVWVSLRSSGNESLREYTTFCAFGGPYLSTKTRAEVQPGMDLMVFDEFGDQQMELNRRIDIVEDAHRITAPTLVVGCTHDQMVPLRHQKALFGAIENSRFAEIPTGHAVVFERPSELCHHVQQFLDVPDAYRAGSIIAIPKP